MKKLKVCILELEKLGKIHASISKDNKLKELVSASAHMYEVCNEVMDLSVWIHDTYVSTLYCFAFRLTFDGAISIRIICTLCQFIGNIIPHRVISISGAS